MFSPSYCSINLVISELRSIYNETEEVYRNTSYIEHKLIILLQQQHKYLCNFIFFYLFKMYMLYKKHALCSFFITD